MSVAKSETLFMVRFNLSVMKRNLFEARPEEIKKQPEDDERSMRTQPTGCRGSRLEQKEGRVEGTRQV
jgi:hypothetical protein